MEKENDIIMRAKAEWPGEGEKVRNIFVTMDTCLRSSLWSGGGQTDYLSPYLFILNVELLSSAMKIINGVNKNNS